VSLDHRPWASAVVVRTGASGETMVLQPDQHGRDHSFAFPTTALEEGESPLAAAVRAAREQTGAAGLGLLGYLGQQRTLIGLGNGSFPQQGTDWYLLDATHTAPDRSGGAQPEAAWRDFAACRPLMDREWLSFADAADSLSRWRASRALEAAPAMHGAITALCADAQGLCGQGTALVLCGSAPRGDYVHGWSDLDFVAYTTRDAAALARGLRGIAAAVQDRFGIQVAVRVGDPACREVTEGGPLYDMKLRAVARRAGIDTAVLIGRLAGLLDPLEPEDLSGDLEVTAGAARLLLSQGGKSRTRLDSHRRALSVMCSSARLVAYGTSPSASFLLPALAQLLDLRCDTPKASRLLRAYDEARATAGADPDRLESLARAVPDAIDELRASIGSGR
jgi:NUDIX domain